MVTDVIEKIRWPVVTYNNCPEPFRVYFFFYQMIYTCYSQDKHKAK